MRVGKLVRTRVAPGRFRVIGLLRGRAVSDPEAGGQVVLVNDWSIVDSCPAAFVEVEANVRRGYLDMQASISDERPNPLIAWQLLDVRILRVLGEDWLRDTTCERDVPRTRGGDIAPATKR